MILIIWLLIAVLLIICEVLTSAFFFVCVAIGAIFAGLCAYCFVDILWVSLLTFILISIIFLYTIRPLLKRIMNRLKTTKSNVDSLIGADAIVIEDISFVKAGFVKVSGEVWRAKSDDDIKVDQVVKIKSIDGTSLIVSLNSNYIKC